MDVETVENEAVVTYTITATVTQHEYNALERALGYAVDHKEWADGLSSETEAVQAVSEFFWKL